MGEAYHSWAAGGVNFVRTAWESSGCDRYSLAFFFNPTWDVVSEPLPTCVGPDNPPKFEPGRFLDYLSWYVDSNFSSTGGGKRQDAAE